MKEELVLDLVAVICGLNDIGGKLSEADIYNTLFQMHRTPQDASSVIEVAFELGFLERFSPAFVNLTDKGYQLIRELRPYIEF